MFEINLVPDVKEQLLKKQKMRNFVIFLAIIVAAGSAALVALLGMFVVGQNVALSGMDREMKCRSEGETEPNECKDFGTAILKIPNINEYLTIQNQMSKISTLNSSKLLLSRMFGVLDVILPVGDDVVEISELMIDLPNSTLTFDASGDSASGIDYRALEVFKNIIKLAYYDHGYYMRHDAESGEFVKIPSFCVDEIIEEGISYGIYHKGAPGCEAPMMSSGQQENNPGDENGPSVDGGAGVAQITDVKIKRTYKTEEEKQKYQEKANEAGGGRYYFESSCIAYTSDGRFDEPATRDACKLSFEEVAIRDSANARDSGGNLVLRFSAAVMVNKEVFRFANKHMRIIGPTRQNVTDSYTQIRDMFTERPTDCKPDDVECQRQGGQR